MSLPPPEKAIPAVDAFTVAALTSTPVGTEVSDPRHGHRSRLRERFQRAGLDGFARHEVVELLLTLCIPRRDVKVPARELLSRFGSLRGILDAPAERLAEVEGIGEVTPVALRILKALMAHYLSEVAQNADCYDNTDALRDLFRTRLGELRHEVFEVAFLNKRYQLLPQGIERLATGLPDRAVVYPRQVMQAALAKEALFVVLAHNHPSGQPNASPEDHLLTQRIVEAGRAVGVRVLDHIIITPDQALSFLDEGHLDPPE